MKQLYRVLPIVLSVGLFGCGNSATQSDSSSANKAISENKEAFVSQLPDTAPVIKVATTGTMPPFSFQDDYGNMQGIDIDSIRAIGEAQGFKVEFYKETWQDMFDSVESGGRDLAISGISYKVDRDQRYGLSNSYFFNPSAVMYEKKNLTINSLNDLKGLHVAGMEGTKQVDQVREMGGYSELSTTITTFLLFEDLMQGKVDAIVQDLPLLQYTAANHPEHKVVIVPYEDENNPSAQQVILMAKGNGKLINTVNEGITKLKDKGIFKEIEQKWLGGTAPATTSNTTNQQTN
ncbi:substrate-binding periplasmic protein [Psychrobacter sp. DAB_AL43B]|uniref:substrate-binding periplasmic protein n=1 Tax=Psychrobacter sp. DAB_AL43B TaxID=1028416 RepID=UPI0009A8D900|nr:transporter substrate-binding domain-containing protein [Psychrobacter sp. DAB_AL43B]SLJ83660.1 extracellular solute-binding protein [Psychrobacter sp. DAB_AL43B]